MSIHFIKSIIILAVFAATHSSVLAQAPDTVAGILVNYDESKVGTYTLPDPLKLNNGKKVTSKDVWMKKRRPEILEMYKEYQFGQAPSNIPEPAYDVFDKGTLAYNETVIRKQVRIFFSKASQDHYMDVLIYLPKDAEGPVPVMQMINFTANSAMVDDPGVRQGTIWNRELEQKEPAPEKSRFGSFDIKPFTDQGIGIAMVYYGDISPDFDGGAQYGVQALFKKDGIENRNPDEWGAIASWSWGLSRIMDYFETDDQVDANRVALFGISRLGKTVLWTGARDDRFAMVIASCSGQGGAALNRRNYGEAIAHITAPSRYDYQFAVNYQKFGEDPNKLPFDSHMLISLMAPRSLLLQTGDEDLWSDPKGEFLAAVAAEPVYELFGEKGLETDQMPSADEALIDNPLGYYMHEGGHGTVPSDYEVILEFIQKHL